MMINKKLINLIPNSKKYITLSVIFKILSLFCNILIMGTISYLLGSILDNSYTKMHLITALRIFIPFIPLSFLANFLASKCTFQASKNVKPILRNKLLNKLFSLGQGYNKSISTAEILQISVEGIDQIETYFSSYVPQFFYSMLAPLILFIIVAKINFISAVILFLCVPLIPISIIFVQKFAKKLLSKYWGKYTKMGNDFLDNIQGLTTLKIYDADDNRHKQMNKSAQEFRYITMKVLMMQLNSITIMDFIAYGGSALAVVLSLWQLTLGNISIYESLFIILIVSEFFIPLRLLGSFFHISMNGMAASDKMFKIINLQEEKSVIKNKNFPAFNLDIEIKNLNFSYEKEKPILKDISMKFKNNSLTAIVGESGSGKSTIASILSGKNLDNEAEILISDIKLQEISNLPKNITYVSNKDYIFKGSVKDNLLMANPNATDDMLFDALDKVNLLNFLQTNDGLDTILEERGNNLSGGQKQRLSLARALLHNSSIYIFDEVTSNIDIESENIIINLIYKLSKEKNVILISHRLANIVNADLIYVLEKGVLIESGTHHSLLKNENIYFTLWRQQSTLEKVNSEAK